MLDYQNPASPNDVRVADLLSRLTLDEKIAQLHSLWLLLDEDGRHVIRSDRFLGATDPAPVEQLLEQGLGHITRPLGTRRVEPRKGVRALNRLQKHLVEGTRWGIPALPHEECLSGLMAHGATLFPSALALGATWNPELIETVAAAIGAEAYSVGARQGLAPVLDVARDARWGRTEETFGEDPYLCGVLGTRYVQGLQGQNRRMIATLKHYAGHSASEGGRNHAPVHVGWRELNDVFLLPFEMAIKNGAAGSVMPAYHDIDGEPLHASRHLLTGVLREQWGFDGLIVADYGGIGLLHSHHGVAADRVEAAALSFGAGLDIDLPADDAAPSLKAALSRGLLELEVIDAAVRRCLFEKLRLGLFENPYTDEASIELRTPSSIDLALEVAAQSVTLLHNDGVLPLKPSSRVAVIGPTANDPLAQLSDYSFPVHLINQGSSDSVEEVVTPLVGLRQILGTAQVTYAQGCFILEERRAGAPVFPGDVEDHTQLDIESLLSTRLDLIDDAVTVAQAADVAIVCVGDLSGIFQTGTVGEGSDTDSLELPGVQQTLLERIVDTGTPVVAVLTTGRPYRLGSMETRLAAQVMAWFGGEQGGRALARVLVGDHEPGGRLSVSIPSSAGACPYYYNHSFKSAGTPVAPHFGTRFPFGHGLSYTRFEYLDLSLENEIVAIETGSIRLRFTLRNTGGRQGVEVVQLYVRDRTASVVRPVKELKGFGRVSLVPGASAEVNFQLPVDMLGFTGLCGTRRVEPGLVELMIGASSADIRLQTCVDVIGERRTLGCRWRMESHCTIRYHHE